ncbi:DUF4352 domain-containing protein [Anaerobacillus sp. HL2]|nr:DUF4352 domain-containing protein [Anaerobacillus sp. HL2]
MPERDCLYVDVTVENTNSESANISSMLQTTLYNSDSYAQNMTIVADAKGSLGR